MVVGGCESERTSQWKREAVTRAVLRKGGLAIKGGDISVTAGADSSWCYRLH